MIEYNNRQFVAIGKRISDERKRREMNQEKLLEELSYRGVSIGRNRLSDMENGVRDSFSGKHGLDILIALCSIFECDLGYLVGEYDEHTKSISDICKVTGLSEESVNALRLLNDRGHRLGDRGTFVDGEEIDELKILDYIITTNRFHPFISSLTKYLVYGKPKSKTPLPVLSDAEYEKMYEWVSKRGLVIDSRKNVCEMHLQSAADELKNIFREVLKSSKEG